MVSPEQTFSQHVRETLQYLMRVDASGKQRNKIDAFYYISLYAICNESIIVPSGGGREKTIHGWSQLRVVFKAIIYRSLCLKARPSDVDAYALQDESDQMAHIADDEEDMTPAEIRTRI